jgi:acyl-CoA synthetase (AMP-forming)/AMP-acid ligase II
MSSDRWMLRRVPVELSDRYFKEGWWDARSLGQVIHDALATTADSPFVVHSDQRPWRGTIAEVARSAQIFGGWLGRRGIGPGDVVAVQLPNWMQAAVAFWGAAYAGATVVPVVHFYGAKELDYILRVCKPALLVTPDRFGKIDYVSRLADLVTEHGVPWAVVTESGVEPPDGALNFTEALDGTPMSEPVAVDPDGPAIIAFTSGTTRSPKGVIHSHRTIGFEARQTAGISPPSGVPPIIGAPVGHFMGMLNGFLGSIIRGVPIHLLDVWDPQTVLRLMTQERIGLTGGATYFFASVLDHPDFTPDHLRYLPHAGLGGAPVPLPFARRLTDLGIQVMRCYGSTEHPTVTGCAFDEDLEKRLGTDGHPLTGIEVRVDDEGQIFSRGPDLFGGYTDHALNTAAFDADGWYRTGDVGILDEDGFLTITDRISDIVIRGGENIAAKEVEELLLEMPEIAEVAVVAEPDQRLGERAVAVVQLGHGKPAPTLDDVRKHLDSSGLAKQKWPESIRFVAAFPRTPSGKIQKFKLRAQLHNGQLDDEISR